MRVTENKMKLLKEKHGDFNEMSFHCVSLSSKLLLNFHWKFNYDLT